MRLELRFAAAALLGCILAPATAGALTFTYQLTFDQGAFPPDFGGPGEGTPRGVTVGAGGNLLVADSLDDQIYETTNSGSLIRALQTNPYCEVTGPPTCLPGVPAHSSGFADGVAYQSGTGEIWLMDDPNTAGVSLHRLDGDGLFLEEFNIASSVIDGGGIAFDSRNGDILITKLQGGTDQLVRLDETNPEGLALALHTLAGTSAPTGLTEFSSGIFLVIDAVDDKLYEYSVPLASGATTLLGESVLLGFDLSPTESLGVAYDPTLERLYIADNIAGGRVHVFTLVPEPGTASLTALGLVGLAALRRRRRG